jgi:hypothetical protein
MAAPGEWHPECYRDLPCLLARPIRLNDGPGSWAFVSTDTRAARRLADPPHGRSKGGCTVFGALALTLLGLAPAAADDPARELLPPVRVLAAGKPIDTAVGHAAPLYADFDGDGVKDLLVGQFGNGILWVYRNVGTNERPRFAAGVQFKDGKKDGRVPTG